MASKPVQIPGLYDPNADVSLDRYIAKGEDRGDTEGSPLQLLQSVPTIPIFNPIPNTNPYYPNPSDIQGMNSFRHPAAVPYGSAVLVQNLRLADGTCRCRDGIEEITVSGLPSSAGTFRGAFNWQGILYAAYAVSSKIQIYRSTDAVTWVEVTQGTNAIQGVTTGSNRMADTGTYIKFQPATAPVYPFGTGVVIAAPSDSKMVSGRQLLLASNGVSTLVLNGETSSSANAFAQASRVAVHQTVPAQDNLDVRSTRVSFQSWATMYDNSPGDPVNGQVYTNDTLANTLVWSLNGSGGVSRPRLTIPINCPSGLPTATPRWGQLKFAPLMQNGASSLALDTTFGKQFVICYQCSIANIWDSMRIEIVDNSSNRSILYDPLNSAMERFDFSFAEPDVSLSSSGDSLNGQANTEARRGITAGYGIVAFPLDQIVKVTSTAAVLTDIRSIRILWEGSLVTAAITVDLLAVAVGGNYPGGTQYAVSYLNSLAQSESPGTVLALGGGVQLKDIGGPSDQSSLIPEFPSIFYTPLIPFRSPAQAQRDLGVDRILMYRRDYLQDNFYAMSGVYGSPIIAEFNTGTHAWGWASGGTVFSVVFTAGNQTKVQPLGFDVGINNLRLAPDAFQKCIQPFTCSKTVPGRGFFANAQTLQVSEQDNMFRHRETVRFVNNLPDPGSASQRTVNGETFTGMDAVSASIYGANRLYVWTDQGTYALESGDPRIQMAYLGPIGLASQRSLASFKQAMWFVDDQRQVRSFADGTSSELSRSTIEDWLQSPNTIWDGTTRGVNQSRISSTAGVWNVDKFYLAFTPQGASFNTYVLIFNRRTNAWVLDVPASGFSCEQWVSFADTSAGITRVLAFGDGGRLFSYERQGQTTDFGTAIPIALYTREYTDNMWAPIRLLRLGIVCDQAAGQSLTVTRKFRSGSPDSVSSINMDVSGGAWNWCPMSGGRGVGARAQLTATVPSGWRLYSIAAELESAGGQGAGV